MPLDSARAEAAVQVIADKLKVSLQEAAYGIFSVVGESMAAAARAHATDRGVNYRGMPMLAFGGAGPVHACYVAERLDSAKIIYPPMASVLSAFGTLVTPARLDLARGGLSCLGDVDWSAVQPLIDDMLAEGKDALNDAGIADDSVMYDYAADMRYVGQQAEVTVALAGDPRDAENQGDLRQYFDKAYENLYGVRLDDMDVEVVSWRVIARGGATERHAGVRFADEATPPKSTRPVYLVGQSVDTPVYDRNALAPGQDIEGPVIIEERETTVFVLPGWCLNVHSDGSLIATRG
jgi:N-methylhydantoinase A